MSFTLFFKAFTSSVRLSFDNSEVFNKFESSDFTELKSSKFFCNAVVTSDSDVPCCLCHASFIFFSEVKSLA